MRRSVLLLMVPALLTGGLLDPVSGAQTPSASPAASISELPEGPLGDQIGWLMDTLNNDTATITTTEVEAHFGPEFLKAVPVETMVATLVQFGTQYAPLTMESGSITTTTEEDQSSASYIMVGGEGTRFLVTIAIIASSNLIEGLFFQPAPAVPAPGATPETGAQDEHVSFESGDITIYGSLMIPDGKTEPGVGALIISGSGPTDRNGNSPGVDSFNTNLNLATTLADQGVTSLRYDKLGSGETGLQGISDPASITASVFLQEAIDAATFLASQPTVDPTQLVLVGHSEGALFALKLAEQMIAAGTPPAAVILVSPLSIRYLDLLDEQITAQLEQAVATGQVSASEADASSQALTTIIESLRTTGELPDNVSDPILQALFSPANLPFLVEIDQWDPAVIASKLPTTLPVLAILGEKDSQVTMSQVEQLMAGFAAGGNTSATLVTLPDANHLLKDVPGEPNPAVDYIDSSLPFSSAAVAAINEFLAAHELAE